MNSYYPLLLITLFCCLLQTIAIINCQEDNFEYNGYQGDIISKPEEKKEEFDTHIFHLVEYCEECKGKNYSKICDHVKDKVKPEWVLAGAKDEVTMWLESNKRKCPSKKKQKPTKRPSIDTEDEKPKSNRISMFIRSFAKEYCKACPSEALDKQIGFCNRFGDIDPGNRPPEMELDRADEVKIIHWMFFDKRKCSRGKRSKHGLRKYKTRPTKRVSYNQLLRKRDSPSPYWVYVNEYCKMCKVCNKSGRLSSVCKVRKVESKPFWYDHALQSEVGQWLKSNKQRCPFDCGYFDIF